MTTQETPVAEEARGQAQNVAGEAKSQAKDVAVEARDQAQNVAQEAKDQARDLTGEARQQLVQQSDQQRDRLVSTLRELGQELREMADGGNRSGIASELARQASDQVQSVSGYLEGRRPGDLLDDVRSFARRRPGMFLLAAGAAGVLAGRATRGAKAVHDAPSSPASGTGQYGDPGRITAAGYVPPTAAGYPSAGSDYPPARTEYPEPGTGARYDAPSRVGSEGTAAGDPIVGVGRTDQGEEWVVREDRGTP